MDKVQFIFFTRTIGQFDKEYACNGYVLEAISKLAFHAIASIFPSDKTLEEIHTGGMDNESNEVCRENTKNPEFIRNYEFRMSIAKS